MTDKSFKTLPKQVYNEDFMADKDFCAICQTNFENGDRLVALVCGHVFHEECIEVWLKKSKQECPICKRAVSTMSAPTTEESDGFDGDSHPEGPAPAPRAILIN